MTDASWVGIPVVTPEQIAQASDGEISVATVRRFCREGRLPGAALFGRSWVIPQSEAEQFLRTYDRYKPDSIIIAEPSPPIIKPPGSSSSE